MSRPQGRGRLRSWAAAACVLGMAFGLLISTVKSPLVITLGVLLVGFSLGWFARGGQKAASTHGADQQLSRTPAGKAAADPEKSRGRRADGREKGAAPTAHPPTVEIRSRQINLVKSTVRRLFSRQRQEAAPPAEPSCAPTDSHQGEAPMSVDVTDPPPVRAPFDQLADRGVRLARAARQSATSRSTADRIEITEVRSHMNPSPFVDEWDETAPAVDTIIDISLRATPDSNHWTAPPRFGGASSAQREPWHLSATTTPGLAADEATIGAVSLRAASMVGPGHRCEAPAGPRQDAYAIRCSRDGRWIVVAVADGIGSAAKSDMGASIAVSAASRAAVRYLDAGSQPDEINPREVFRETASLMISAADSRNVTYTDFGSLLLLLVAPTSLDVADACWVVGNGDLSVWCARDAHLDQVYGPRKDAFDPNTVTSALPSEHATAVKAAWLRILPGAALALVTDGMGDPFQDSQSVRDYFARRWSEGAPPLMSFVKDVDFQAPGHDDDRTAIVLWWGLPVGAVDAR